MKEKALIALTGRPNTGKSSIFNALIGKRKAIIDDRPGVTRDRQVAETEWFSHVFDVVDTGGLEPEVPEDAAPLDGFATEIAEQAELAINDADAIVLVTDVKQGLMPGDTEIANMLRRTAKPVFVAVNKCDNPGNPPGEFYEFYNLGLGELYPVSAIHKIGLGDLVSDILDALRERGFKKPLKPSASSPIEPLSQIQDADQESDKHTDQKDGEFENTEDSYDDEFFREAELEAAGLSDSVSDSDTSVYPFSSSFSEEDKLPPIKVAIIGKPNVGKSSLLNKLLGYERSIVSDIAGTTRDSVDAEIENKYGKFVFTDTAGLRRKAKVKDKVERYSVLRATASVREADVVLIMIDATEGFSEQDTKIAGVAHNSGKACIICANKWDVRDKEAGGRNAFAESALKVLSFMRYAPTICISAMTGERLNSLYPLIIKVYKASKRRISTRVLNEILAEALSVHPTPQDKGRHLKIYYMTQVSSAPPTFVFFVNDRKLLHFSYERYLENQLRLNCDFEGSPIKLIFRERKRSDDIVPT